MLCSNPIIFPIDNRNEWLYVARLLRNKQRVKENHRDTLHPLTWYDSLYFLCRLIVIHSGIETDCAEITIQFNQFQQPKKNHWTHEIIIMMISDLISNIRRLGFFVSNALMCICCFNLHLLFRKGNPSYFIT